MRIPISLYSHQHVLFSGCYCCVIIAILMDMKWHYHCIGEEAESQKSGVSYSTSGEGDGTPLHLLVSKRGSVLV